MIPWGLRLACLLLLILLFADLPVRCCLHTPVTGQQGCRVLDEAKSHTHATPVSALPALFAVVDYKSSQPGQQVTWMLLLQPESN